jgi:hypothetical protein
MDSISKDESSDLSFCSASCLVARAGMKGQDQQRSSQVSRKNEK